MRDQKTWSVRFMSVMGVALAVGVLLALGSTAASARVQTGPGATPDGVPVQFLELDKIEPSAGVVIDTKQAGTGSSAFTYLADLGSAAFAFPETRPLADATDRVFTNKDGSYFSVLTQSPSPDITDPHSLRGGISHFEELQAYRKRSGDATLRITISNAILRAIDENRNPSGCPPKTVSDCPLLRGVVLFHARAYAASAGNDSGGDFFTEGGVAYLEGHRGHWTVSAATDADSQMPLWDGSSFRRSSTCACIPPRAGGPGTVAAELRSPLTLTVPLDAVRANELFAVHVTLESEATNDRGGESTSLAFIDDPEHVGPGLLKARGLKPLGKPHFREPKVTPPPAAVCTAGPSPHSGKAAVEPRRVRRHRGRPHPDGARDPQCRIARRDQRHRAHERWLGALGTGLQAHDHTRHLRQQRHLPAARGDSDPRGQGGRVTGELHRFPVSPPVRHARQAAPRFRDDP